MFVEIPRDLEIAAECRHRFVLKYKLQVSKG